MACVLCCGWPAADTPVPAVTTPSHGTRKADCCLIRQQRLSFTELGKDYISGITFSGGDPLFPGNREEISELCREIRQKFPDKTIWLYTGYRWEEIKWLPFLDQIDVLIDGRFVQAQADPQLHWRGSANQRVIDVPRTLAANSIVLHDDK